ncbi:MAG: hypothetical protein HZC41_10035 [Chloroflexi bacterium]|nr:hypothetical protein [Chloroflexota bacterium]
MTPEDRALLIALLTRQRVLALSVLVDGAPYTGLLPFAALPDFTGVLVHASKLARHSAGLEEGAPFSLLIHQPDTPEADPQQLPRVALEGAVRRLAKDTPAYTGARAVYLAKFPTSEPTFNLGDFDLYRLECQRGRFVAAFGRIYNLAAATLRGLES